MSIVRPLPAAVMIPSPPSRNSKLSISALPAANDGIWKPDGRKSFSVGSITAAPMSRPARLNPNAPAGEVASKSPSGRAVVTNSTASIAARSEPVSMPKPANALTLSAPITKPATSTSVIVPPLLLIAVVPSTAGSSSAPIVLSQAACKPGPKFCGTPVPKSTSICGPISKPKLPSKCRKSNRLTRPYSKVTPMR